MKHWLFVILIFPFAVAAQQDSCDLLIKGGKLIDGSGNNWQYLDVAVKDGKIVNIAPQLSIPARRVLDAEGLYVAPGFIDVHTHIEKDEMKAPDAASFLRDGVTSVVTGNCGSSETDLGTYFHRLDSVHLSINVASLIGHNSVRTAVMGRVNRAPTAEEQQGMDDLVSKAMLDGAVGFSTGLIYIPGAYSKTDEVVELAKQAGRYHGIYASHMRSEGDSIVPAIREALLIGTEGKMPVEISHFKVSGQQNWGRSTQTLDLVKAARNNGVDVTVDQYPYTASSTSLTTMLPDAMIEARLQRPELRKEAINSMLTTLKKRKLKHFSYPVVAYYRADTTLNGKSIEEINLIKGRKHKAKEEAETVLDLLSRGNASMVFHGMGEPDVERIMQYPFTMFASDASIRIYKEGVPHPRGYGTNARVLSYYVREKKILTLEDAIRKMTSLPAEKFRLAGRGLIKEGAAADIVVFDAATVSDHASYADPHQYSTGFAWVIVNGQIVIDHDQHTGSRPGQILYGPGKLY